ncbi:short-chain dehydrogenase [Actinophytocola xinjiangensis]|uniref:Short-chain dehydrogenase n=1 Tax=Actinophytocola xinjiangensis TaxID=485602 RepID=A0A7Z0WJM6_9PSEU|nr:SDR family NAD(P)-dependent oxidoreductase [Actinophytocola xinjiangensis]OLF07699.1 short-chain dehydrogenase [Actinophytocola xinjiangensis]
MICAGRVVAITGAGRGIGREHALEFARQGAAVVVNDVSGAGETVAEITAAGGRAVAHDQDVSTWAGAESLVDKARTTFDGLDVLVNNAGILRDRMLVGTSEREWDEVVQVHLRAHFLTMRIAGDHWRTQSKSGEPVTARVINTTSGAGLFGSVGQASYTAAKAGIVGLTLVGAAELGRYGVTVNAIAPVARTRLTEGLFPGLPEARDVAPLVVWLGSSASGAVTGRVFEVAGDRITVIAGHTRGPSTDGYQNAVGPAVESLLAAAPPEVPVYGT